jgi:hypothetical protein
MQNYKVVIRVSEALILSLISVITLIIEDIFIGRRALMPHP